MSNFPFYENINLNTALPVLIQKHYNDATGAGCEFHWHEEIEIYYVKSGGLKLNSRGNLAQLNAGDIGLVGWGHPHRGSNFKDGTVHYILQIDLSKCAYLSRYEILQIPELLPRAFIFGNEYLANILDGIIREYETRLVGYDLKIMSGFHDFFTYIMRNYMPENASAASPQSLKSISHVHEILRQLNKNYLSIYSLDELAKKLGLSKEYMCRIFKKHTGHTIVTHLNEQRCHYAASLILQGTSLSSCAELAGYSDYNYFSRVFKKIMKKSPAEYANQISL